MMSNYVSTQITCDETSYRFDEGIHGSYIILPIEFRALLVMVRRVVSDD